MIYVLLQYQRRSIGFKSDAYFGKGMSAIFKDFAVFLPKPPYEYCIIKNSHNHFSRLALILQNQ